MNIVGIINKDIIKRIYELCLSKKIIIIFTLLLFTALLIFTPKVVSAESSVKITKAVTVIQIESGDTIWSIAKEFYTSECGDLRDYVQEIKKSNGLSKDTINAGNYLIIPYYSAK